MYEYHGNKGSRRQQEIKEPLTLYRAGGFLFISCRRYQTDHLQIYSGGVRILNVQLETEETEISEENAEASEEITEDTEKESRLTVIAAGSLIDEQIIDTFTELENTQLFMNIMAVNFENVKNVSIEAKSLSVEYNAVQHAGLFGTLMIFGIPAVILISGFVVWYRRRKA